jgi:pimeloyl-ACP methyl ester carboxylesterase
MRSDPTLVMIPCFSGVPWQLAQLESLSERPMRTMRLPERLDDTEAYADFVMEQCRDLGDYVLVGDSFGGLIALAVAVRQPPRLRGLVLSGAFACAPVDSRLIRAAILAACLLLGPLYPAVTLRLHAAALRSPYDTEGEAPWSPAHTRELFARTPRRSYAARARAALRADYTGSLHYIRVPTLILTPEHDYPIGSEPTRILLEVIPNIRQVVLPRTGYLCRFSHPLRYAREIEDFLRDEVTRPHRHGWLQPPLPPLTAL